MPSHVSFQQADSGADSVSLPINLSSLSSPSSPVLSRIAHLCRAQRNLLVEPRCRGRRDQQASHETARLVGEASPVGRVGRGGSDVGKPEGFHCSTDTTDTDTTDTAQLHQIISLEVQFDSILTDSSVLRKWLKTWASPVLSDRLLGICSPARPVQARYEQVDGELGAAGPMDETPGSRIPEAPFLLVESLY